jgi:hypothetical protein
VWALVILSLFLKDSEKFQPEVEKAALLMREDGFLFGKLDSEKYK